MKQPRYWLAGALVACCLAISANAQFVTNVVNTVAVSGITGLGTGIATLLGATPLGSGGLVGATQGTWTPVLTANTPGTPAYSTQTGTYEINGRQVTARFAILLSGWTGSPSGAASITGLPGGGTAAGDQGTCVISQYAVSALAALSYGVSGGVAANTTVISLLENNNTGQTTLTAAQLGTIPLLVGSCFYRNG